MWKRRSLREQVELARGRWLVYREGTMEQYVSNKTGVPIDQVWDYILGRRK